MSGLQPDLLGERLVADSLAKDDELIDIVFKNPKNASEHVRYAYTVLTRLARQDDQERQWLGKALERHFDQTVDDAMAVAMETGSPMPEMITSVLQTANRPGRQKLVNALRVKLPKDTVNLMELAIEVAEQHVKFLANQGNKKSFRFKLNTKDAYDLLASRYESTGRFKEAVDARQKALEFARALPNANRASNRHTLAQAYLKLAVIYGKTCYFGEALENEEQAESILRTLAQSQPGAYRPEWARSLNNLGNRLGDLGRYDDALKRTQQAETIYQELAQAQPGAYRPEWAKSLNNLAEALLRTGDARRALLQAEYALEVYTGLAVSYPKIYQEQRGWCQRVLAEIFLEIGDTDNALAEAHNAVTVLYEMFNERPGYAPEQYGKALEVLARCQHDREGVTASVQTLKRAVQDLGPHYERRPAVLQTVMQNIVERLRSLAPGAAEHEIPQNILDLLDRHKA